MIRNLAEFNFFHIEQLCGIIVTEEGMYLCRDIRTANIQDKLNIFQGLQT